MSKKIQNLRGPEYRLPVLLDAQIALTTDTGKTFIGHAGENIELAKKIDLAAETVARLSGKAEIVTQLDNKLDSESTNRPLQNNTSALQMIDCAESFHRNSSRLSADHLEYGNLNTALDEITTTEIDCSSFVGLCLLGVPYSKSKYAQTTNERKYDYGITLEYKDTIRNSNLTMRYAYEFAEYCHENGFAFKILPDYSNLQPGDLIFWRLSDSDISELTGSDWHTGIFEYVNHVAIYCGYINGIHEVIEANTNLTFQAIIHNNLSTRSGRDRIVFAGRIPLNSSMIAYETGEPIIFTGIDSGYASITDIKNMGDNLTEIKISNNNVNLLKGLAYGAVNSTTGAITTSGKNRIHTALLRFNKNRNFVGIPSGIGVWRYYYDKYGVFLGIDPSNVAEVAYLDTAGFILYVFVNIADTTLDLTQAQFDSIKASVKYEITGRSNTFSENKSSDIVIPISLNTGEEIKRVRDRYYKVSGDISTDITATVFDLLDHVPIYGFLNTLYGYGVLDISLVYSNSTSSKRITDILPKNRQIDPVGLAELSASLSLHKAETTAQFALKANDVEVRKTATKIEPEDASATLLGLVTGTGGPINLLSIPQDSSVTHKKMAGISSASGNLFPNATLYTGKYVYSDAGTITTVTDVNYNYFTMTLTPGKKYTFTHGRWTMLVNASNVVVRYLQNATSFTAGATETKAYISYNVGTYPTATYSISEGNTALALSTYKVPWLTIDGDAIDDDSINVDKLTRKTVDGNIFGNRITLVANAYAYSNAGVVATDYSATLSYFTIALDPNTDYSCRDARFLVLVDANNAVISGGYLQSLTAFNSGTAVKAYISFDPVTYPILTYAINKGLKLETDIVYTLDWLKTDEGYMSKALTLPPNVYGVVGQTIKIFFGSLPFDIDGYRVAVTCTKGSQYTDRWEHTASISGTFTLKIGVFKDGEKIAEGSTTVTVVAVGTTPKSVTAIIIGDSTTANGGTTQRLLDDCAVDTYLSVTLLGTMGVAPNLHEGRGGWTASNYYSSASVGGTVNPFYNSAVSHFDFDYYLTQKGYADPNYVGINLGINDTFAQLSDTAVDLDILTALSKLDLIVASIKTTAPSAKIGIFVTTPPNASQDIYATNYGCSQTQWRYRRNNIRWVKALIEHFTGVSGVYLVPVNLPIDAKTMIADGVHPTTTDGYPAEGDVLYALIKVLES